MSLSRKVQYKLEKDLVWLRESSKLPNNHPHGHLIFDAREEADRIAAQLRADPARVLPLVIEELEANPAVQHYTERYGPTLRPEYRKYHYVILEEK